MMEIQKELKHDALVSLLMQGKRADGRGMWDYRNVELVQSPLENAEGSAICRLGKTQVLAGVKVDLATPFPDRLEEGVFSTGAEFTPLGSHMFEPGPPSPAAIELARVVDRGIRSSECIGLKSLTIPDFKEKVIAVYLDLWIMDHDGNLFDAAALAGMAALMNTRMPKMEGNKIVRGEYSGMLNPSTTSVSCTFAKVGDSHLLDPTLDEQKGMDGQITIATTPQNVCAVQKSGWAGYTQKDILELVDISFKKGAELRRCLGKG
jgi:exosome complex component RRP42